MALGDTESCHFCFENFHIHWGGLLVSNNLNPAHSFYVTNSYCFRSIWSTVVTGGRVIQTSCGGFQVKLCRLNFLRVSFDTDVFFVFYYLSFILETIFVYFLQLYLEAIARGRVRSLLSLSKLIAYKISSFFFLLK